MMTADIVFYSAILVIPVFTIAYLIILFHIAWSKAATQRLCPLPLNKNDKSLLREWGKHILIIILMTLCLIALLTLIFLNDKDNFFLSLLMLLIYFLWLYLALIKCTIRSNPFWKNRFLKKPKVVLFRTFRSNMFNSLYNSCLEPIIVKYARCYFLIPPTHKMSSFSEANAMIKRNLIPLDSISKETRKIKCIKDDWRSVTRGLASDAQLVIFHIDEEGSQHLIWEIEMALGTLDRGKIIFIFKEEENLKKEQFAIQKIPNLFTYRAVDVPGTLQLSKKRRFQKKFKKIFLDALSNNNKV
jgi:hypothetical protein